MPMRQTPVVLIAAALALAGCAERPEPAPVVYRGTEPGVTPPTRPTPTVAPTAPQPPAATTPDASGVIDYGGYSAIMAREGDTVSSMAARAGLSGTALASYNGLPSGYAPRPGDELILPPRPDEARAVETTVLSPLGDPIVAPTPTGPAAAEQGATGGAFDLAAIEAAIDGQSTAAAPAAPVPRGAERVIFAPSTQTAQPSSTIVGPVAPSAQTASAPAATGTEAVASAPPAAQAARPEAQAAARPAAQAAAQTASAARFVAPVQGRIVRPFNRDAGARSDGVDFAAPQGAAVVAAAPGQVALVSESLGGLGTIVLIRHEGDLLTVYGRVDGVTVKKGDRVQSGQTIGAVAPGAAGRDPSLHFEVRQGAESVDPERFLPG